MTRTPDTKRLRILILFGGRSDEHEVSILSATNVMAAIDRAAFDPVPVYVARDGVWRLSDFVDGALSLPVAGAAVCPVPGGRGQVVCLDGSALAPVDAIFPVLHGQWGEDGAVPGVAAVAQIPLVGCGILGSANALDKEMAKRLLAGAGLPVARAVTLRADAPVAFEVLAQELGLPFFLKPATQGSSVGVGKVSNAAEYHEVLERGFALDRKMLAEAFVAGREVECAVLEEADGTLIVSRPGEIVPGAGHAFYTYDAKYIDADGTDLRVPADLPEALEAHIRARAAEAFRAVGCDGMARVDFFLLPDGALIVNELNTIPGFTDVSMYAKVMAVSGVPYGEVISRLIAHGIARFQAGG
jgi:D-alanine-D-alanine ligase